MTKTCPDCQATVHSTDDMDYISPPGRNPKTYRATVHSTSQPDDSLLRCAHGNCLRDGSGELLEPPCGCRAALAATPAVGMIITDTMIEAGARIHNPFAFDGDVSLHRAQSRNEARKEVHAILSAALAAASAVDATQGALALYLNEVQPVDGRVQINVSIDELTVLRHLAGATPAVGGEVLSIVEEAISDIEGDSHSTVLPDAEVLSLLERIRTALAAQPASPLRGRDDLIPAGKQAKFKHGKGGDWFGVYDWHNNPESFEYRTVYALSASPPEQPAAYPSAEADKEHADLLRRLATVPEEEK